MFSQMSGQHFALSRPLDDEVSRVQTKGGYSEVDNFKRTHFQIITCIQTSWITLFCSVITVVTSHLGLDTAKAQWQVLHRPHGKQQQKASPSTLSFTSDSLLHLLHSVCLLPHAFSALEQTTLKLGFLLWIHEWQSTGAKLLSWAPGSSSVIPRHHSTVEQSCQQTLLWRRRKVWRCKCI